MPYRLLARRIGRTRSAAVTWYLCTRLAVARPDTTGVVMSKPPDDADLWRLVLDVQEQPGSSERWIAALDTLSAMSSASSATLGVWAADHHHFALHDPIAHTWPQEVAELFFTRYRAMEPLGRRWDQLVRRLPRRGGALAVDELMDPTTLTDEEHVFLDDFAIPCEVANVGLAVVQIEPGYVAGLSLYRDDRTRQFEPDELATILRALSGLRLAMQTRLLEQRNEECWNRLDQESRAIFLVDAHGTILRQNRRADQLLGSPRQPFRVSRGRLGGQDPEITHRLRQLHSGEAREHFFGDPLRGAWYYASALPNVHTAEAGFGHAATFWIEIGDLLEPPRGLSPERLQPLGLTRSQARVAALVRAGLPRKEIAAALGIADTTVRNHLRVIYQKLGIAREARDVDGPGGPPGHSSPGGLTGLAQLRRILLAIPEDL